MLLAESTTAKSLLSIKIMSVETFTVRKTGHKKLLASRQKPIYGFDLLLAPHFSFWAQSLLPRPGDG